MLCLVTQSCPTLCDPVYCSPPGSSIHGDFSGPNTGVSSFSLLQGNFPNPEIEPRSSTMQAVLLPAEPQGKPLYTIHIISLLGLIIYRSDSYSFLNAQPKIYLYSQVIIKTSQGAEYSSLLCHLLIQNFYNKLPEISYKLNYFAGFGVDTVSKSKRINLGKKAGNKNNSFSFQNKSQEKEDRDFELLKKISAIVYRGLQMSENIDYKSCTRTQMIYLLHVFLTSL